MPDLDLEVIANTSYVLLLASYIMRDILWLRILTVISLGFEIPYFYFQADPLWAGISWDVAFVVINVYWIARLVYERRPVHFSEEQQRLYEVALHRLHPHHARKLFKSGTQKSLAADEVMAEEGDVLDEVALITEGKIALQMHNKKVEELSHGHFIGTAAFLERGGDWQTLTTIVAVEPTQMITWNKRQLSKLIEDDNQLGLAIEASLGLEIARLLARSWNREALTEQPSSR